ncbi:hypothetical protein OF83DRAFT_202531 [Amylostereum chailletii]|nr:hypothetical protein OF83DRAFT_202531 [Amylostereum chailletii]
MSGHDLTTALSYILSMPALESLTLKQENLYFLEVPLDMLPSSYAPHLKQVTLINCKFQALPAAFSNLTSLSIAFDVFDCTHLPPDFDKHLVAILEGMPYLEDLSLRDAFPPSLSDRRILRFPSTLKTISLEAAYRFVPGCIYLANASIPCGSLRTSLTLLSYPDHQPDIEGLVSCILGPKNPPSAISLTFHSPYNIVLRGWRNTWTSTPSFLSCSAPPADFSIADNRTQTYSCIKDVSYGACLEDVRELFMQDQNCGMHVPLEQWIPAFSHARKVHTLVIRGRPASLLETLVQTSDGESGKEPLLFPKLEILVLSFRDSDLWDVLVTPGELFERLEECLKVRRECGCPVCELHLPKGWRDIQSVRRIEQERVVDNLGFLNEGYA